MTLDEAITYCDEKAKEHIEKERYELAGEYLQFRAWVKELKRLRESERPQGEWIDYSEEGFIECPFCHKATTCEDNIDELHFCWNCGAEMRKGEEE